MRIIVFSVFASFLMIGCIKDKKPFQFDDNRFAQWDCAYVGAKKHILLKNDNQKNLVRYQNVDRFKNEGISIGLKQWIKGELPLDLYGNIQSSSFLQLVIIYHTVHSSRTILDFYFLVLDEKKSLGYNYEVTLKGVDLKSIFPVVNSEVMAYINQIQDPSDFDVPDSTTLFNHEFLFSILTKDSIKVYPYEDGNFQKDQYVAFKKLIEK